MFNKSHTRAENRKQLKKGVFRNMEFLNIKIFINQNNNISLYQENKNIIEISPDKIDSFCKILQVIKKELEEREQGEK